MRKKTVFSEARPGWLLGNRKKLGLVSTPMIHSHSSFTKAQRSTVESYLGALVISNFRMWLTFSLINLKSHHLGSQSPIWGTIP